MANESTVLRGAAEVASRAATGQKLRAVNYLRVSTDQQMKGYGVASQGRRTVRHIANKGWQHVGTYVDGGVSGSLEGDERPGVGRLMKGAYCNGFDVVVVKEARAIGRTGRVFWNWVWALEDVGIFVSIVDDDVDNTTPEGRTQMLRKAGLASAELETIRARVQDGLQEKALGGGWTGGQPPYGYRIESQGRKGLSRLVIDEFEANVLRRAWKLLVEDQMNIRQVALKINSEGMRNRSGLPWSQRNLRSRLMSDAVIGACSIFRHPARPYVGRVRQTKLNIDGTPRYGETVIIPLEPIFTPNEVQHLKDVIAKVALGSAGGHYEYPLSGRVFNSCGAHYIGQGRVAGEMRSYRCSGKDEKYAGAQTCSCQQVDADALEERVWEELGSLTEAPERLAKERLGAAVRIHVDQAKRIVDLDRRIGTQSKVIETVVSALTKQALEGGVEDPESFISEATRALTDELAQLRSWRHEVSAWQADAEAAQQRSHELQTLAATAKEKLRDLSLEEQSKFLAMWDVKVTILGDRSRSTAGRPCSLEKWFRSRDRLVPNALTDEAWVRIEPLMAGKARVESHRQLIDGILYKARTGVRWCDLPKVFGNYSTIHTRCAKWIKSGMWDRIMEQLGGEEGVAIPEREVLPPLVVKCELPPRPSV